MAGPGGAVLLAWLILIAAAAKSAQGPLYFWLPSAMAGPTPVSALIHAATMVAAGVYLLARTHGLLEAAPERRRGDRRSSASLTALGGGDRSACCSPTSSAASPTRTVSQLGYMFAGVGFGAPFAAMFHLVTHASFKALLFLTAGVVIHALHGREKLADMGGLRKELPGAYAGVPDRLAGADRRAAGLRARSARTRSSRRPRTTTSCRRCSVLGLFAGVFLTGLYTGRLFFGVFHGPRGTSAHSPPAGD